MIDGCKFIQREAASVVFLWKVSKANINLIDLKIISLIIINLFYSTNTECAGGATQHVFELLEHISVFFLKLELLKLWLDKIMDKDTPLNHRT